VDIKTKDDKLIHKDKAIFITSHFFTNYERTLFKNLSNIAYAGTSDLTQ
jgi:hypothetical protein